MGYACNPHIGLKGAAHLTGIPHVLAMSSKLFSSWHRFLKDTRIVAQFYIREHKNIQLLEICA